MESQHPGAVASHQPAPQPPQQRSRPVANPLVKRKRPVQARPNGNPTPQRPTSSVPLQNGQLHGSVGTNASAAAQQLERPIEEIPIYTTKRALVEGTRYHILRFFPGASLEQRIDPTDVAQFTPPVRLHRRDRGADPAAEWQNAHKESSPEDDKPSTLDEKAQEEAAAKAARAAEREAARAEIAPTAKSEAIDKRKKQGKQKKTEMVYQFTDSATKKKNQQLRYEEAMPWHLEDFDNKNIWLGNYESALSECHIMLVEEPETKSYRMVPLEKWYRFLPRSHVRQQTPEESEQKMAARLKNAPAWIKKREAALNAKKLKDKPQGRLFGREGERGERAALKGEEGEGFRPDEAADADLLDYEYEEAFADDEENPLFGGEDDEVKEAEDKIKKEQAEANVFHGIKEEKDYDEEEAERKRKELEDKEKGRKVAKALKKRERDWRYENDSDEEEDSSDEEDEDGIKKEEGEQARAEPKPTDVKAQVSDRASSGAASRGTSISAPDGTKGILKRPVSPNQSDLSGNESSRKKQKKTHATNAAEAGASISRTGSPANGLSASRKSSTIKLNFGGRKADSLGAGSGSEGEMSDGAKRKKKKTEAGLKTTSPNGSRAASPANAPPKAVGPVNGVTAEDIMSNVPPEGRAVNGPGGMLEIYGRANMGNKAFQNLVRYAVRWNNDHKLFYPK